MTARSAAAALLDEDQVCLLTDLDKDAGAVFLGSLCEHFACDARRTLARMREFARHGDGASLAREAHRLVGSSGSIGASGFARDCLEIERRARLQETAGLDASIDDAQRLLESTLTALRGRIGRRSAAASNANPA